MKSLSAAQPGWYVVPVVFETKPAPRGNGQVTVDKDALPYAFPVAFWMMYENGRPGAGFTKDGEIREVVSGEPVRIDDFTEAGGHQQSSVHWKIMHKAQVPKNVKMAA